MRPVSLRPAAAADISTIMEIEQQPGFEHLVGRSARSIHEELVADPGHAYLLGLGEPGTARGFAILRGIGDPHGGIYLKRIAIRDPGQGFGSAMLASVIDWAFSLGDSHRFFLDHFASNERAHQAYEKCGLRQEGVLRQAHRLPDGRFADLVVMAILRPDWAASRNNAAREASIAALSPLRQKLRGKGLATVAEARRRLFAPLESNAAPETEPEKIFRLWSAMQALHPTSHRTTETGYSNADAGAAASLVGSLAPDLDRSAKVDVVFSHSIAASAGFIDWYERFAGAFHCDLGGAIEMIDRLERAGSPLLEDDVAIAAADRQWAIWVNRNEVLRTKPGR